jgi:hypothetical protein
MSTQQLTDTRKWGRSPVTDPDFLEEYERETTWAPKHGITKRTSQSYRNNETNGLPFLRWGGEIWIHKKGGAEYIASRIKRRNPRAHRNPRGRHRSMPDRAAAP